MFKQSIVMILLLFIAILAISGCTTKTTTNGTFGEKYISKESLVVSNNTTAEHYNFNGTEYYYIKGYIQNNNKYDAFHVKLNTNVYDVNGNILATNDSAYLNPTTIPANGASQFYVEFKDPDNKIIRYEVKVIDAKGTM